MRNVCFFSSNVLPNILWLLDAVVFLVCCFQHVMCVITRGVLNCFFLRCVLILFSVHFTLESIFRVPDTISHFVSYSL